MLKTFFSKKKSHRGNIKENVHFFLFLYFAPRPNDY